jgi:hypothetical protein
MRACVPTPATRKAQASGSAGLTDPERRGRGGVAPRERGLVSPLGSCYPATEVARALEWALRRGELAAYAAALSSSVGG